LAHCDDIVPLLSAFKDSELPPLENDQVTLHLENCTACRDTLLDFVLLGHQVRAAMALPALDGFADGVMNAIAQSPRPLRERIGYKFGQWRERWVAGAAVAGVAIATATLVLVLADPQISRFSQFAGGHGRPPATAQNEVASNETAPTEKPLQPVASGPGVASSSAENSQTYISRLESRHPSVATWSEPDSKTTVIWLGDDNSGND
jgi:anti-sigma factor RsiW